MKKLKTQIAALPTIQVDGETYLSYQAVTNTVAAFLFPQGPPTRPTDQMDAVGYQRVLETADTLCRELGYASVVKLSPPTVPFSEMGLYWTAAAAARSAGVSQPAAEAEPVLIHAGPDRIEMIQEGLLLDARLSRLGLAEVTRQHFKIPVTASDAVIDLMQRAVNSDWPNDFRGIWHDILGMCVAGGRDISATERVFTVIIRGLGQRRYWRFKACIQLDNSGAPFLTIHLADEGDPKALFALGHVVMTPGAAELGVDFAPYLARHAQGDWGDDLDNFDRRQNDTAVKEGYRILSAYTVPVGDDETERIWIITEADRSATTVLLPSEY
ncbi:hypothetical protein [Candidatus Leptofilum sp.]|uniref:hypothetical protein n=1 Tax=Candidatus Leptofilum sp. TaxID=3241576 RepID=UPI003B59AFB5